ncbi:MAG TPA: hypothetical protein VN673_01245 [Clostridia bacterium]|nr:hypothetical protein [Clostridia bacterium]
MPLPQLPSGLREVPLYRHYPVHWTTEASRGLEQFQTLPLITKTDLRRDFPRNFLPAEADLEEMIERGVVELEHTSGTSEERTPLLLPAGWWREQEERAMRLNPLVARVLDEFPEARRVTISSPVCSGEICYRGVPSRADRTLGNSLYVSLSRFPFLWSESDLARMAAEAAAWQPQFLDVDPVYGVVFALYCERHGIRLPSLQFVLCTYEFVSVAHRRILERVFGVPVLDLYGSTETGHLLMEFNGGMRPSCHTAFLEVINRDEQGIGELVVTTLTNGFMPLVRYWIGDLVEQGGSAQPGYLVHGRVMDALQANGRRVTTLQVDRCFAGLPGIAHYQLIRGGEELVLRYVPDGHGPDASVKEEIQRRLSRLLESPVRLHPHTLLMPESSGKFRLVALERRGHGAHE